MSHIELLYEKERAISSMQRKVALVSITLNFVLLGLCIWLYLH